MSDNKPERWSSELQSHYLPEQQMAVLLVSVRLTVSPSGIEHSGSICWLARQSVISCVAAKLLDVSCGCRRELLSQLRLVGGRRSPPLRSVRSQPQETSPDLNLNGCLHLCHYNNLRRF